MKRFVKIVVVSMAVVILGGAIVSDAVVSKAATTSETVETTGNISGGWTTAKSAKITKAKKKMFNKAMEGLTGVDYEPVAYLGSQVVAGTNHCFLCKATVVYPGTTPYYALVYIYKDLDGNVELLDVQNLSLGVK